MTLLPIRLGAVVLNSKHPVFDFHHASSFCSHKCKLLLSQNKLWDLTSLYNISFLLQSVNQEERLTMYPPLSAAPTLRKYHVMKWGRIKESLREDLEKSHNPAFPVGLATIDNSSSRTFHSCSITEKCLSIFKIHTVEGKYMWKCKPADKLIWSVCTNKHDWRLNNFWNSFSRDGGAKISKSCCFLFEQGLRNISFHPESQH